jgi:molybdopterin/thiamine biosynthesis adenylyltransferase
MANNMFLHEEIYRGEEAVAELGKKHITICGAGTLGSNLAETLARQGIKNMRIIDMDRVEKHNLNTQAYGINNIGQMKVEATYKRLYDNVEIAIEKVNKELNKGNAKKFLKKTDLVIDTFDNNTARQLVQDQCRKDKTSLLHAGLNGDYGEVVWDKEYTVPQDQGEGDVCEYPLARNLAMFVITVAAEEIVHFLTDKKHACQDQSILLNKAFQIVPYR